MTKKFFTPNSQYIICDVCGKKIRASEAVLIKDKYNLLHNLLVCRKDADKTNPQQYIRAVKERQVPDHRYIRSEGTDVFVTIHEVSEIETGDLTDPDGTVPGAPEQLTISGATATEALLQWQPAPTSGSGAISGYKIERESPIGGGFSTLTSTTQSVARTYTDSTVSSGTEYNYRVSAVNKYGTGDPSNEANVTTS